MPIEEFNVKIHDDPELISVIKVTDKTIESMDPDVLSDIIITMSYTIQLMTVNLPLTVKEKLSTTTDNPLQGVIWLYNCDPQLRESSEWGPESQWELLSDISGYSHLAGEKTFDGRSFAASTYGVGGIIENPLTSICVHNITCPWDALYNDENIFVHEYAHTILEVGVALGNRSMYDDWQRIHTIYESTLINKCPQTYSCSVRESFALASQVWFDATRRPAWDTYPGIDSIKAIRNIGTDEEPHMMYDFLESLYGPPVNLCIDTPGEYGYDESALMRHNCSYCT